MGKRAEQIIFQMAIKHMKKNAIRKMPTKPIMKYYFMPTRTAII